MRNLTFVAFAGVAVLLSAASAAWGEWAPAGDRIQTRWAADVSPENVWPEYPRPQLVRDAWQNLNGLWEYAIRPRDEREPDAFDGEILVPFCAESSLSGVGKMVGEANRLWYRRSFSVPEAWGGQRVLLHFQAVDWDARVWVNGTAIGKHRGGYDSFSFDITGALKADGGQTVVVSVWDPTSSGTQPRGKQVNEPQGIWYSPVTGIWQTVWLEPVPPARVEGLTLVPDIDRGTLAVTVAGQGAGEADTVHVTAMAEGKTVATVSGAVGSTLSLNIEYANLWSPDSPFLYDLSVRLERNGKLLDEVKSYFGMRKIAVAKDAAGVNRLFLNNKPLFQFGPLDQGWWPDGLYTAPTDEALKYDVAMTKALGFNLIRKHVKIEPDRWYYHCDTQGVLVWQDMPNGGEHIRPGDEDGKPSKEVSEQFELEYQALLEGRKNHPSIVMWVVFNEGWGQYKTEQLAAWTKRRDPSRLVNQASGWSDRGVGDVYDLHRYPGPIMPRTEEVRAAVLGEFGGLGLVVEGHLWWNKRNWGYRSFENAQELRENYQGLIDALRPLIAAGLTSAVYTQTTDVEGEVNGLMTYDRAQVKMGTEWVADVNRRVYAPLNMTVAVPTSEASPQTWRYTTEYPGEGWQAARFRDRGWSKGAGPFGAPGAVGTEWNGKRLFLRRSFELEADGLDNLWLYVRPGVSAQIYINGVQAARVSSLGRRSGYMPIAIEPEAKATLEAGKNTLAVSCSGRKPERSIDVGLVILREGN